MSHGTSPPALPLWERVEALRLREGWTRVRLAQRAGVSRGTIENWKTQPRAPLADTIKSVASNLGIDHTEALELAGITRNAPARKEPVLDDDVDLEELMQDPEARAALRTVIERIRRMQSGEPPEDSPHRDEDAG